MFVNVIDFKNRKEWRVNVSEQWFRANDPGHAFSIGLVLRQDISEAQLKRLTAMGKVREIAYTGDVPISW